MCICMYVTCCVLVLADHLPTPTVYDSNVPVVHDGDSWAGSRAKNDYLSIFSSTSSRLVLSQRQRPGNLDLVISAVSITLYWWHSGSHRPLSAHINHNPCNRQEFIFHQRQRYTPWLCIHVLCRWVTAVRVTVSPCFLCSNIFSLKWWDVSVLKQHSSIRTKIDEQTE